MATQDDERYEVLYNKCYGGFTFPLEFVEKVFTLYPPHSALGTDLFPTSYDAKQMIDESSNPDPSWTNYQRIKQRIPFVHGYSKLVVENYMKDLSGVYQRRRFGGDKWGGYIEKDSKVYFISEHMDSYTWRRSPEVIALAKADGLIGVKFSHTELGIAKVPVGYDFEIQEYDGKESVVPEFPYRQVIHELVEYAKDRDESKLSPLALKAVRGTLPKYF